MANHEKDTFGHESLDERQLEKIGNDQIEKIAENLERKSERDPGESIESARKEALEQAAKHEKETVQHEKRESSHDHVRTITKKDKEQSFDATMNDVRTHLSPASRAFSKIIHQPAIEKVSDTVGNTIARPNAILSGSVFAFLFTMAIYLIARSYGYPLSGGETIAAFVLGWVLGLIFDYVRALLGKK